MAVHLQKVETTEQNRTERIDDMNTLTHGRKLKVKNLFIEKKIYNSRSLSHKITLQ